MINVTSSNGASTLDLTNAASVTSITSSGSATNLTLGNIQSPSVAVTINNSGAVHTLDYANAAVTGTSDTANVSLNSFSAASDGVSDLTVDTAIETLALTVTGTNAIDSDFAGAITVAGAGSLTLTGVAGNVLSTSINAGNNTGGITAIVAAASTLTGGSGSDSFTMAAGAGSISGGAGNDTIVGVGGNDTISGGDGNDSITAGAGADNISGGAGDDRIIFATATNLTVADTIDAGSGTDTLVATAVDIDTNTDLVDTADLAALVTGMSTFETLEVSGVGAAGGTDVLINANRVGANINKIVVSNAVGANASTFTFNAGASEIDFAGALGAATHVLAATGTGTSDTVTVVNTNSAAADTFAGRALTLSGIETVSFNSGATATLAQSTGAIGITGTGTNPNLTINVTGANAFTLGAVTPVGTGLLTISGSGLTAQTEGTTTLTVTAPVTTGGTVSISGSAGDDVLAGDINDANTIVGGAGLDTITGGSAADSLDGGAGNDTITGSGGNDTLVGNAGNDQITGGSGNDSILGGDGNDTIATGAGSDTVDGGAGNDGITSTSTTFSTITGGAGNDTITNISGGVLSINGGDGDDSIVRTGVLSLSDTISGGSGTDTLTINNTDVGTILAGSFTAATTFLNNLSDVERLSIDALNNNALDVTRVDGISYITLTTSVSAANASSITNLGNDATVVLSGNITNTNGLTLGYATTTGTQTLNLELASAAGVTGGTITSTAANVINLTSNDTDVTTGGNATDAVTLTAAAATSLVVTGDSATLGLTLTGSTALTSVNASAYEGAVTTTLVASGTTYNGAIGIDNVTGSAGADSILGNAGADVLSGLAGADTISGGDGNDQITGGIGADVIDGGSGTDTFLTAGMVGATIEGVGTGDSTGTVINLGGTALSYSDVFGVTAQYLSTGATTVAAGKTAYLFNTESALNSAVQDTLTNIENVTLTGNGINYVIGSDAANSVTGGTGVDYINGGAGNDTISGGASADVLTGGEGADSITGGAGADSIVLTETTAAVDKVVFTAAGDYGDTITGFTSASDVISLAAALVSNGTNSNTLQSIANNGTVGANSVFIEITTATAAGACDTDAEVATALAGLTSTNVATGEIVLFVLNDGSDSYVWSYTADADAVVDAGEVALVAKLTGVTDVASGDLATY